MPSVTDRLRKKLSAPSGGFATCAIVGSSGELLRERLGATIDAHDLVVRINLAPVGGYEEAVGSKTSLRVLNTEATGESLLLCCARLAAGIESCPQYAIVRRAEARALD